MHKCLMLGLFWLGALTLPCLGQTPPADPAGFVIAISGKWVTVLGDPQWSVHKGSPVYPGQQIGAKQPVGSASITIVLLSGVAKAVQCAQDANRCTKPIIIDEEPVPRGAYQRIVTAVMKLVSPEEPGPVMTVARDVFGPQMAVLSINEDQLDLRPALKHVLEGTYLVELARDGEPAASGGAIRYPVTVATAEVVLIKPGALRRGLYRLTLFSGTKKEAIGNPVLVLAAPAREYESLRDAFAQARDMTSRWDDNVDASSAQYLLIDYLRALATDAAAGAH